MVDSRSRSRDPGRLLLAVMIAIVSLGLFAAKMFEFPGDRVTIGAVVVSVLLFIGALALPALLLTRWQSDRESR